MIHCIALIIYTVLIGKVTRRQRAVGANEPPSMGLLDLPPNHAEVPGLKLYSLWLKLLGNVFLGIFPVAYILKWGVAWHDAGSPFNIAGADGINFNA